MATTGTWRKKTGRETREPVLPAALLYSTLPVEPLRPEPAAPWCSCTVSDPPSACSLPMPPVALA